MRIRELRSNTNRILSARARVSSPRGVRRKVLEPPKTSANRTPHHNSDPSGKTDCPKKKAKPREERKQTRIDQTIR